MKNIVNSVLAAQNGDVNAYAQIYRQYQNMAITYAYSLLYDFHDAEDAAQNAFIIAFQRINQVRDPLRFASWFRRIVFTHADRIKRKRHSIVALDREVIEESAESDPAQTTLMRETQLRVLGVLDEMPPKPRQAVLLCYICGYTSKEIGAFLDVSPSTVRSRLMSSRKWLDEESLNSIKQTTFQLVKGYDPITLKVNQMRERLMKNISDTNFTVRNTTIADAFDMHEYWSDIESCRYNNQPLSLDQIQNNLQQQINDPKFEMFAVVDRSNKVIGDIAVFSDPGYATRRHIDFLYNKKIDTASETMKDALELICKTLFQKEKVSRITKHAVDKNVDEIAILKQLQFSLQSELKTVRIDNELCVIELYILLNEV